jgi:hypothetical protein
MGDALEHRNLLCSRFASAGRHVGFLIPREDRSGTIDALNFQEFGGEGF